MGGRGEEVGLCSAGSVLCCALHDGCAGEDGAGNSPSRCTTFLTRCSLRAKEMTLNGCGRRSPAPCLEAGVSAQCCKPWVVQRLVCVLQLGAAAGRAAERVGVRMRRWLEWSWSFPFCGKKALGTGLFAVRLSNRYFLTRVFDSVTKAAGDCWGWN